MSKKNLCPSCGSEQFLTEPNQYDIMIFDNGSFDIESTEIINDELTIFCRECSEEVDVEASEKKKRVILKEE